MTHSNMRRISQVALLIVVAAASLMLSGCGSGSVDSGRDTVPPRLMAPADGAETSNAILFRWDESNTAPRFRVQIAADEAFTNLLLEETSIGKPHLPVRDLPLDAELFWRVRSESDDDASAWSSTRRFEVVSNAHPPDSPGLTIPADGTLDLERTVQLAWDPVPDAYSYHLVVTIDEDMYLYQADLENLAEPEYELNGLIFTYPYWWKVRALGPAGYSEWSPVWIFWVRDGD